jgi:hypothetical protein
MCQNSEYLKTEIHGWILLKKKANYLKLIKEYNIFLRHLLEFLHNM